MVEAVDTLGPLRATTAGLWRRGLLRADGREGWPTGCERRGEAPFLAGVVRMGELLERTGVVLSRWPCLNSGWRRGAAAGPPRPLFILATVGLLGREVFDPNLITDLVGVPWRGVPGAEATE